MVGWLVHRPVVGFLRGGGPDELVAEAWLAVRPTDRDDLVADSEDRIWPEHGRDAVADDGDQRAAIRDGQVRRGPPDARGARLEMGLDDLELGVDRAQVEELVDRDVLLDRAEDHPGGADELVNAEVAEQ